MSLTRTAGNKAILGRLDSAMNSGDAELIARMIDEVFAPDVRVGTPLPLETTGAEAMKEVFVRLLQAFPDLHITVEDVIAEGDKVVCRNTVTGTHLGEYLGIPATGRSVTYKEIMILRFDNGRVVETWGVVDVHAQLKQLGVLGEG
ncbi:ester cyclase [Flindersiella endophytica]